MTWNDQFLTLFRSCLAKYKAGNKDFTSYYSADDLTFLKSIGYKPRELFDFVEDLAEATGLPIGIKSAVGELSFWNDVFYYSFIFFTRPKDSIIWFNSYEEIVQLFFYRLIILVIYFVLPISQ